VKTKRQIISWLVFAFVIGLMACAGGLIFLKVLPEADASRIMSKLPSPLHQLVDSILFPHPAQVPTPIAIKPANLGSLLTPIATSRLPIADSTSTPVPTITPSRIPAISPSPAPSITPSPVSLIAIPSIAAPGPTQAARSTPASPQDVDVLLRGAQQYYQTWNNCGPATLAMNLSFYGSKITQADAAKFLKPDSNDKNVSPDQMLAYAKSIGFQAIMRVNGGTDLIKTLLRNGLPILVEKGFEPEADLGWMGHYELIVGFNDTQQQFIAMDSYMGPYQAVPYDQFDKYWRQFNRTYLVVYPDSEADQVASILGDRLDDATMWNNALARSQQEAAQNPNDPYAWFDLGSDYVGLGDMQNAATAYDHARSLGLPWRMTWYQFGWFEAYVHIGRYEDVIALADATIKVTGDIEEMYYYKGLALKARGDIDNARANFQIALQHNPNFVAAQVALNQ
jgi:tetratricopeptide (TPR) repeat protein